MQSTEVTQIQFASIMGYNPSGFPGCDDCPVENVNWHQSAAYCNGLSQANGLTACYACTGSGPSISCSEALFGSAIYGCAGFRLPTEAEWEYSYRAGTTTAYYGGAHDGGACSVQPVADAIGWYSNNSSRPMTAGGRQANSWGLYDMGGNVWEWCHDPGGSDLPSTPAVDPMAPSVNSDRIIRGGSWYGDADFMRAAYRAGLGSTFRGGTDGFRCVRTLAP
jgi:formylglycine-generating enzyme required for sulfatase activity